ncbi:MAG: bifunctional (p)ppGpp synthetase/guanosine-3',5'-bis(diphosphate) 3'-pyrophosphohydrolase [Proteobacteria bacterium]|nr:bifunctional (p)ppGpp synthetase/guanosine-3',5'-bis(diphosphate) 3'-pyrophosphohydrolase [Pseudomonadota bacterium]
MIRIHEITDQVLHYNPQADVDLIRKAYVFSAKVHRGQTRLSGEPYLIHPLEVAGLLTQLRMDATTIACGLLHDTLEDTLTTREELLELFGKDITEMVDGVTKISKVSFGSKKSSQAETFRKMILAMAKDLRVILVKLADRVHNIRTLEFLSNLKQNEMAQETMDVYAPLAGRLGIYWMKTELEDLSFKYSRPNIYYRISEQLAQGRKERERYIEEVIRVVNRRLAENRITAQVNGRMKNIYSIYRKMETQGIEFEQVHDLIAFRIITSTIKECYEILGLIHSLWKPVPGKIKDYIAMPKAILYQSLHTTVIGPYGERVEIQIRTEEMHRVAEEGVAAHWRYKETGEITEKDGQKFAWLRQLLEWQKELVDPSEFMESVRVDLFPDEVYVFTPKGDVREFPRGATPVDFAYSIHTELGNTCVGAKANGRIVPLTYKMQNGDRVEILTQSGHRPSKDWLKFVRTSQARNKIRQFIRRVEMTESQLLGQKLLEREISHLGQNLGRLEKQGKLEAAAKALNYKDVPSLLAGIGYGKTSALKAVGHLIPEDKKAEETAAPARPRPESQAVSSAVSLKGVGNVFVRFAKCCHPIPGDPILGFITRGRGVTIHSHDCPRVLDSDPERRVEVNWDAGPGEILTVRIRVLCVDEPGLLAAISRSISAEKVNIQKATIRSIPDRKASGTFEIQVEGTAQLNAVIKSIEKLEGVISVGRDRR